MGAADGGQVPGAGLLIGGAGGGRLGGPCARTVLAWLADGGV